MNWGLRIEDWSDFIPLSLVGRELCGLLGIRVGLSRGILDGAVGHIRPQVVDCASQRGVLVAGQFRLKIPERNVEVLGNVESGDKLAFVPEPRNRIPGRGVWRKKTANSGGEGRMAVEPVFETVADIFPAVAHVLAAIKNVFAAVADVLAAIEHIFLAVDHVFSAIAHILEPVRRSAVDQGVTNIFAAVTDVLAPIQHVFPAIAHILTAIPDVFATIPHVFATIPDILAAVLRQRGGRLHPWPGLHLGSRLHLRSNLSLALPRLSVQAGRGHADCNTHSDYQIYRVPHVVTPFTFPQSEREPSWFNQKFPGTGSPLFPKNLQVEGTLPGTIEFHQHDALELTQNRLSIGNGYEHALPEEQ